MESRFRLGLYRDCRLRPPLEFLSSFDIGYTDPVYHIAHYMNMDSAISFLAKFVFEPYGEIILASDWVDF